MPFNGTNRKNWLIAGFIAAVLALLVAFLLILSYNTILAEMSRQADQAIDLGDKIHATFSRGSRQRRLSSNRSDKVYRVVSRPS
jgi:hypothetical protein